MPCRFKRTKFSNLTMINSTFKYHFSYIKIKITNERNYITIMKKKKDSKHTQKKLDDIYNPLK